jgi:hypothetical protein
MDKHMEIREPKNAFHMFKKMNWPPGLVSGESGRPGSYS